MGYKACPECGEEVVEDVEECDCGHVFTEEDEEDGEPTGPEEGDYTTTNDRDFYQYGKLVVSVSMAEYDEDGDAGLRAIAAHMKWSGFYPNVWSISDHGNAVLQSVSEYLN